MMNPNQKKTNVPTEIREMWTDLYKLFDGYFLMENTDSNWEGFWTTVRDMAEKHGRNDRFLEACCLVSDCIADRFREPLERK